jgi:aminoglycoside/choline kinase family phosphotransferase
MGFYEREVRFYTMLGGKMTFRIPRCYAAAFDAGSGLSLLILEDLTGLENGNSIAGCSGERAESIVRMLARFHAAWWNNPELANLDWLNQTNNLEDQTRERMLLRYWEGLCQAIGDDKKPAIDAITARLSGYWSVMTTRMDRSPLTLVHGDFQLSNLFFDPQWPEADPIVTDFQAVSFSRAAAYDLGFFMGHSLDSQVRRAHEARLLDAYYTTLLNHGVQDYPYAEFLDDYRFGILHCMIRLSFMMAGELIKDRNVFMARVQRYCAAIEDNQAWQVLEMRGESI